tara:strand:- start:29881 stop:30210 length:330 start_codon:yes stop_codon:yes gene_type:complete
MKPKTQEEVQAWIVDWLKSNADISTDSIELDKPFADYHLDSVTSVELSYDLEEWSGKELSVTTVWNYPTINKMAEYLSDKPSIERVDEDLLTRIENLTDEEAAEYMRGL